MDDEQEFRLLVRIVLEQSVEGVLVTQATTAEEAMDTVAGGEHDVILLDVHLPDGNGAALLPSMRRASPRSLVVLMSSDPDTRPPPAEATIWIDKANLLAALPGILSGSGIFS